MTTATTFASLPSSPSLSLEVGALNPVREPGERYKLPQPSPAQPSPAAECILVQFICKAMLT